MSMAILLGGVSFMLAIIWGGPFVRILRQFKIGKQIRIEGPQSHFTKLGTPTMGGLLIVAVVVVTTIVANIVEIVQQKEIAEAIVLPLLVMAAFAVLGAVDDWSGLGGERIAEGLYARTKFIWQVVIALATAAVMHWRLGLRGVAIPTIFVQINIGIFFVPIAAFLIISASNAVNFADGLDGLAGLLSATAFAAYGIIAALQDQLYLARFCFIVVGACFAFLWFNSHPAQMFMGDVGSLSLGAALGVVAVLSGQWLLLPIIAIVPVAEVVSVIIQVGYFKLSGGKRVFKMAPLHHHFELLGWSETQVVQRFWIVGLLGAMVGIALALV